MTRKDTKLETVIKLPVNSSIIQMEETEASAILRLEIMSEMATSAGAAAAAAKTLKIKILLLLFLTKSHFR